MEEFYNYDEHAGPVLKPLLENFKASAENWYLYFRQMAKSSPHLITTTEIIFGDEADELVGKITVLHNFEVGFLVITFQPNAHFKLLFSAFSNEIFLYEVEPSDVEKYEGEIRRFFESLLFPSTFIKEYTGKNSVILNPT